MQKEYLIQKINIMDFVDVSDKEINICKEVILNNIKEHKVFSLETQLSNVTNNIYKLEYNSNNMMEKIKPLLKNISTFMAFQEASLELVNENLIMPIELFYMLNYPRVSIHEVYENINKSTVLTIGNNCGLELNIYIPIITHGKFILRPSKKRMSI